VSEVPKMSQLLDELAGIENQIAIFSDRHSAQVKQIVDLEEKVSVLEMDNAKLRDTIIGLEKEIAKLQVSNQKKAVLGNGALSDEERNALRETLRYYIAKIDNHLRSSELQK